MGLRNSKPKHSKDKKMENSVRNKHGQQMNKFTEQTPEIGDSAKKSGKPKSDVGIQIEKNINKKKICQINESAQVTDESDTENEDSVKITTEETEAPIQDLYKQPKTQITHNISSKEFRSETGVFNLNLGHDFSDIGFQAKKNKSKNKCQINESAQVTDESDTDNKDSTKIKTEETEASIQDLYKQPKTQITNNTSSKEFRSETGVFYLNLGHDFSDIGFQAKKNKSKKKCQINESAQVTDESDTVNKDSTKIKTEEIEALIFLKKTIMNSRQFRSKKMSMSCIEKRSNDKPSPYRNKSSDNNEAQISRMDKIIAQGNIPYVPRRYRPAPPPPDVLD